MSGFVRPPTGGPSIRAVYVLLGFFLALFDVKPVVPVGDCLSCGLALVSGVRAEVPRMGRILLWPRHYQAVPGRLQQLDVMHVGSADDERQRDATAVGQQAALAPIFPPGPSGSVQRTRWQAELFPWPRRCFATPTRCRASHRTRPTPPATGEGKTPPPASPESTGGPRWRCRIPSATPSTGTPCAAHTRWPKRPDARASACGQPQLCGDTPDLQPARGLESEAPPGSTTHPIPSKT